MSDLHNLFALLVLGALIGTWLKLSSARERAVREARRLCTERGLQLLDETVGLRGIGWPRIDGTRRIERCYSFEVSTDGQDRAPGRLWIIGDVLVREALPPGALALAEAGAGHVVDADVDAGKVVPFRPRQGCCSGLPPPRR